MMTRLHRWTACCISSRSYLPSITRHFAYERLAALAHSKGQRTSGRAEVLFVCVQNAGRSQMAAALLKLRGGDNVNVRSAGSMPAEHLNENAVIAMNELGISLEHEYPKPLTDDVVRAADVVITMGCGDTCPIYPGKKYEDWKIEDPEGAVVGRRPRHPGAAGHPGEGSAGESRRLSSRLTRKRRRRSR